jgi:L-asparaginase II
MLSGIPAVGVGRGSLLESVHAVAACAVDPRGRVALAVGDIATPVFLRSSAKPFIAAAVLREGAVARFGFDDREIAVMCASHNGEPFHVAAVERILAKIGATPADLACGVHAPAYEPAAQALAARGEAPSVLHNNCSGKHAGILALARLLGAPLAGYLAPDHPAERAVLALCERVSDDVFGADRLGTDGCGIPVYATPLRNAALSFARLATLEGLADDDAAALGRARAAMLAEPAYVAGTARFDTDLMVVAGGRIACKAGAEGVHADALLALELGLVVKCVDGTRRAVPPATVAVLRALGALSAEEEAALAGHARTLVLNHAGTTVGETAIVPSFAATLATMGESSVR